MTDTKTKVKEIASLVIVIPLLLIFVAIGFYSWFEKIKVPPEKQTVVGKKQVGNLGLDATGRNLYCQTLDSSTENYENSDIRIFCRGNSADIFSVEIKDKSLIDLEILNPDKVQEEINKPYKEKLKLFNSLNLSDKNSLPISITELDAKLEKLQAKTYADFLAACGFKKLILKDTSNDKIYLELEFSETYGTPPKRIR